MGRRILLNIWMAVALVVLVWVVWQEPGHETGPAAVKLTALDPATIDKIVITQRGGAIVLNKQNGGWQLLAPIEIAANPTLVENLLQVSQAESLSRFPAAAKDLGQFGLSDPALKLRFNDSELLIGGITPLDQRRYVMLGDTIHLIADRYSVGLGAEAAAYVSRDLVPKGRNIAMLELPDDKLVRSDKGAWILTPAERGISQDAVRQLVDEWRGAQALRVANYDQRPAQGAVVIHIEGAAQPLRYQITALTPELILARPDIGVQFYLAGEQAGRLLHFTRPAAAAAVTKTK